MEIIFLGTSSGVPTKTRNVSACIVKKRNAKSWCLVDCGEGTQHRLLHVSMTLQHLEAIFITHVHGDHCYGLLGLLASASMSGRRHDLIIVAPAPIQTFIEMGLRLSDTTLNFAITFIHVEKLQQPVSLPMFDVHAVELSHRVPSFAYVFDADDSSRQLDTKKLNADGIASGPFWGKIQKAAQQGVTHLETEQGESINPQAYLMIQQATRRIIVGGDNDSPELLQAQAMNADVLIHESTFTDWVAKKVGPKPQHSSAKQVAEFAETVNIKNLILTHFSSRFTDSKQGITKKGSIQEVEDEAREYYSGELFLAEDLVRYYLDFDGVLHKQE